MSGVFPRLVTPRLLLREMTLDDAEFYLHHFSDPTVVELTAFEAPRNLVAAREELVEYCIRLFPEGKGIRWGIELRDRPGLIGTCGYHAWSQENFRARIGYDLASDQRRKGLMTEALEGMISCGFERLGLHRIEALTDPRNAASIALLRRLGFLEEGVLRENTHFRGRFIDDVCFALLRPEWEAIRRR